jgi:hypothetical protein
MPNNYQTTILRALQGRKIYQGLPVPRKAPVEPTEAEQKQINDTVDIYMKNLKQYKESIGEQFEITEENTNEYKEVATKGALQAFQKEYNKDYAELSQMKNRITKRRAKNKVAKASRKANRSN